MANIVEKENLYDRFLDWEEMMAEVKEEEEETRREEEEKARKEEERRRRGAAHRAFMDSILEHDPKTGREVYTRYSFTDFSKFDIDEESSCIMVYEPLIDWEEMMAQDEEEEEESRQVAEEKARKEEERRRRGAAHRAVKDSILEYDPKTGREVYTRYSFTDFSIFDIDEECKS